MTCRFIFGIGTNDRSPGKDKESKWGTGRLLALQLPLDRKALDDRTEAVRIATVQYNAGRWDLLWVTQLQAAAIATEGDLIKLHSAQRVNRVRLHQVLGGDFDASSAAAFSVATPAH